MNEHELKSALQDVMAASSPPPPMSPDAAVRSGRAAQRRRKTAWAGGVAGAAVVAIAVGAVLVPQFTGGQTEAGGPPLTTTAASDAPPTTQSATPSVTPTEPRTTDTVDPSTGDTKWPDGQTDRTARSGPRADKSTQALNDLGAALPPGFQAVDKQPLLPESDPGNSWFGPMRYTQSQFEDYYDGGRQVWEYMGTTPVTQQGSSGVGKLWFMVLTKGNARSSAATPCDAAEEAWTIQGPCEVRDVGGKKVGFVTADPAAGTDPGNRRDLDELAIHLHEDGTLVLIGQAKEFHRTGHPPLAGQVFTQEKLAALATDPKFHLN